MVTMIDTLMIACMDYRLNERVNEALDSGKVVVLRNAGGDAGPLKKNIDHVLDMYPSVNRILFYLHDNGCGGMKVAWGVNHEHDPALAAYVERFKKLRPAVEASKDQKALEEMENPTFQVKMLKEWLADQFKGRKIRVEFELVHVPEKSHAEHFLLITKFLEKPYEKLRAEYRRFEPAHAYIIQYSKEVKEVMDDIGIAVRVLGLRDIRTIAVPDKDRLEIRRNVGNDVIALSQSRNRNLS